MVQNENECAWEDCAPTDSLIENTTPEKEKELFRENFTDPYGDQKNVIKAYLERTQ